MAGVQYLEKLKDPRWQKMRLEILQRDKFTCQRCNDKQTTLHVHHIYYEGENPWDTPSNALITLCESCHDSMKGRHRVAMGIMSEALARAGLLPESIEGLAHVIDGLTRAGTRKSRRLKNAQLVRIFSFSPERIIRQAHSNFCKCCMLGGRNITPGFDRKDPPSLAKWFDRRDWEWVFSREFLGERW